MKQFFTVLLVVTCLLAQSQNKGTSGNHYYAVDAGITNFHPWNLNNFGNGVSTRFSELYTIGISLNHSVGGRYDDYADGSIAFHVYYRNKVEWFTDSSSLMVRGWELMTSLYGYDLINNKHVDLVIAPGIYWGNLKLLSESRGGTPFVHRYKNPFVAPMARLDIRLTFLRIAVGGRISYRYDITKDTWRSKDGGPALPGYRFREEQYVVYVGWVLKS